MTKLTFKHSIEEAASPKKKKQALNFSYKEKLTEAAEPQEEVADPNKSEHATEVKQKANDIKKMLAKAKDALEKKKQDILRDLGKVESASIKLELEKDLSQQGPLKEIATILDNLDALMRSSELNGDEDKLLANESVLDEILSVLTDIIQANGERGASAAITDPDLEVKESLDESVLLEDEQSTLAKTLRADIKKWGALADRLNKSLQKLGGSNVDGKTNINLAKAKEDRAMGNGATTVDNAARKAAVDSINHADASFAGNDGAKWNNFFSLIDRAQSDETSKAAWLYYFNHEFGKKDATNVANLNPAFRQELDVLGFGKSSNKLLNAYVYIYTNVVKKQSSKITSTKWATIHNLQVQTIDKDKLDLTVPREAERNNNVLFDSDAWELTDHEFYKLLTEQQALIANDSFGKQIEVDNVDPAAKAALGIKDGVSLVTADMNLIHAILTANGKIRTERDRNFLTKALDLENKKESKVSAERANAWIAKHVKTDEERLSLAAYVIYEWYFLHDAALSNEQMDAIRAQMKIEPNDDKSLKKLSDECSVNLVKAFNGWIKNSFAIKRGDEARTGKSVLDELLNINEKKPEEGK